MEKLRKKVLDTCNSYVSEKCIGTRVVVDDFGGELVIKCIGDCEDDSVLLGGVQILENEVYLISSDKKVERYGVKGASCNCFEGYFLKEMGNSIF